MTRIAVLLPSYNPGADLKATVDSLRQQSVPFRLFLVDDGSKAYFDYETLTAGLDVRILRLPKNLGITGAMNAGLADIMQGGFEYIARIDAGDFCTPERFSRQMAYLDGHPKVGIVGSAVEFRLFDAAGNMTGSKRMGFPLTHAGCQRRLFLNTCIIHPAMMIRRAVFETLHAYSEEFPAAEDYDLLWRAQAAGFELVNLDEVLLVKEETPGSISQKRRRRQIHSRFRLQWKYRNLLSPLSWLGLGKSIVTWIMPADAVHGLKFLTGK
jgi:GT2 family glycosyltransferase